MNINMELYKIFYAVANTGNITKASKILLISQPAISKSIKNLETQLKGTLFIRTKRGVILTEEGKIFYQYIKQAMEIINNAENAFTDLINLDTGIIRIGISQTLTREFLLPYLKKFHKLYPNVNIQISTSIAEESIKKINNGLLDLIILNLPNSFSNDVKIIKCKQIQDCFVVNEKYYDLSKKIINLSDVNNYPLILQAKPSSTRKFIDNFCLTNNIILNPSMEIASYALVVDFAKMGLGIGYATKEYIKEELENKKLFELKTFPSIPPRFIGIALNKNNTPNFSAKKLIEIIQMDK